MTLGSRRQEEQRLTLPVQDRVSHARFKLLISPGAIVLISFVVLAIVLPFAAPTDSQSIDDLLATRLAPPFAKDGLGKWHLLGTDAFGRDVFIRLWLGARVSLIVGITGTIISAVIGIALGAAAGWWGGTADRVVTAVGDALLAIPRLILLLVIASLWGPGMSMVIVVLGLTGWMAVMRLVRAEVQRVRLNQFVEGARAIGLTQWRILFGHVLPNSLGSTTVALTLGVGNAIILESGLSFLGLGVQPPSASWGNMISGGRDLLLVAPWIALAPGILLIATVVACTMLGERLSAINSSNE